MHKGLSTVEVTSNGAALMNQIIVRFHMTSYFFALNKYEVA